MMLQDTLSSPGSATDAKVISSKKLIVRRLFQAGVVKTEGDVTKTEETANTPFALNPNPATSGGQPTYSENSTLPQEPSREIFMEFQALFLAGKEEFFEDGMESNFSRKLLVLVEKYSKLSIQVLANFILGENVNSEVASEALRWLGQIGDTISHRERRWLLERSLLSSPSARVRDGALLGLSFLGDPAATPYLAHAIQQEQVKELRQNMLQTFEELKGASEGNF